MRSVFRCAELGEGSSGKLANQQITFMLLESGMIVNVVELLTVWASRTEISGAWQRAGWRFRSGKAKERKVIEKSGQK